MAILRIKNLRLNTEIGFKPHEIQRNQSVVINIELHYNSSIEEESDDPNDILDYREITKSIIHLVENNRFNLLEHLCRRVINVVSAYDLVDYAIVEIDKPEALRFTDSVSCQLTYKRIN
jgi:D-erythro-7,8-dihydroneopterin triphosphate epimerase